MHAAVEPALYLLVMQGVAHVAYGTELPFCGKVAPSM